MGFDRHKLAREHQVVKSLIATVDPDAAVIMQALRIARNQADYDLDLHHSSIDEILEAALVSATTLMTRLDGLRTRHSPH